MPDDPPVTVFIQIVVRRTRYFQFHSRSSSLIWIPNLLRIHLKLMYNMHIRTMLLKNNLTILYLYLSSQSLIVVTNEQNRC